MSSQGRVFFKDKAAGTIKQNPDGSFEFQYVDEAPSVSLTLPSDQPSIRPMTCSPILMDLFPKDGFWIWFKKTGRFLKMTE